MKPGVLVLGATGMLGHRVVRWLARSRPVVAASRTPLPSPPAGVVAERLNDLSTDTLLALLERQRPAAIVNAVGLVKQRPAAGDARAAILVNSLFPHRLALVCSLSGARLLHFSTDCVFSGDKGKYREDDPPDATDLYGRSKLLGEVAGPNCLTMRTSMIGPELASNQGLLAWALSRRGGRVQGYRRAIFSGLPTIVLAQLVERVLDDHPTQSGLRHVAADPISKFDLLHLIDDRYGLGLTIEPADEPVCDRSLDGSLFRRETGFVAPPWDVLIDEMARDHEQPASRNGVAAT